MNYITSNSTKKSSVLIDCLNQDVDELILTYSTANELESRLDELDPMLLGRVVKLQLRELDPNSMTDEDVISYIAIISKVKLSSAQFFDSLAKLLKTRLGKNRLRKLIPHNMNFVETQLLMNQPAFIMETLKNLFKTRTSKEWLRENITNILNSRYQKI